jgi:PleD family two-component response regulator
MVFIIILRNAARIQLRLAKSPTTEKKKILLVDDEPDISSLFRRALMREGFRVDV